MSGGSLRVGPTCAAPELAVRATCRCLSLSGLRQGDSLLTARRGLREAARGAVVDATPGGRGSAAHCYPPCECAHHPVEHCRPGRRGAGTLANGKVGAGWSGVALCMMSSAGWRALGPIARVHTLQSGETARRWSGAARRAEERLAATRRGGDCRQRQSGRMALGLNALHTPCQPALSSRSAVVTQGAARGWEGPVGHRQHRLGSGLQPHRPYEPLVRLGVSGVAVPEPHTELPELRPEHNSQVGISSLSSSCSSIPRTSTAQIAIVLTRSHAICAVLSLGRRHCVRAAQGFGAGSCRRT